MLGFYDNKIICKCDFLNCSRKKIYLSDDKKEILNNLLEMGWEIKKYNRLDVYICAICALNQNKEKIRQIKLFFEEYLFGIRPIFEEYK
jgi:hypothetical protein